MAEAATHAFLRRIAAPTDSKISIIFESASALAPFVILRAV
jgi:hypothetical protein